MYLNIKKNPKTNQVIVMAKPEQRVSERKSKHNVVTMQSKVQSS